MQSPEQTPFAKLPEGLVEEMLRFTQGQIY